MPPKNQLSSFPYTPIKTKRGAVLLAQQVIDARSSGSPTPYRMMIAVVDPASGRCDRLVAGTDADVQRLCAWCRGVGVTAILRSMWAAAYPEESERPPCTDSSLRTASKKELDGLAWLMALHVHVQRTTEVLQARASDFEMRAACPMRIVTRAFIEDGQVQTDVRRERFAFDDADEVAAMLEGAGLIFERPDATSIAM